MAQLIRIQCKDCWKDVYYAESARAIDLARNLSPPERCPEHRKLNAAHIKNAGAAYWNPPVETDESKRCLGKFGLGRLHRNRLDRTVIDYEGVSVAPPPPRFQTIAPVAERLLENLLSSTGTRVSVLVGPTGTGKSTWVPYRLLRSALGEQGRICVTQPRLVTLRAAEDSDDANTTPGFIAKELLRAPAPYVGPGQEVGVLYKGEATQWDRYTRLLFVTDGILINWLVTGEIRQFDVVIVDEAHEQSRNMELIFALLKYRLQLFPRLRVVIASATVDVGKFCNYFGDGDPKRVFIAQPEAGDPVGKPPPLIYDRWPDSDPANPEDSGFLQSLNADGHSFPLPETPRDVPQAAAGLVTAIRAQPPGFSKLGKPFGDIIIFVPTVALVEETMAAVTERELPNLTVYPCHAQMRAEELSAFKASEAAVVEERNAGREPTRQRVIVATNYAETSVTISNLCYVIDSGFILNVEWDPLTGSMSYRSELHSQAGCTQRRGRVGRIADGECFRLYTRERFNASHPVQPVPSVSKDQLDMFLLAAKAAGIDNLTGFRWLGRGDERQEREVERAIARLNQQGALDGDGDITKRGVELQKIQTRNVDLALFMSESDSFACALEVATFLAYVDAGRSPFLKGSVGAIGQQTLRSGCLDDLEFYLRVIHLWMQHEAGESRSQWCTAQGLDEEVLTKVIESRDETVKQFAKKTHTALSARDLDLARLHRVRLVLARCMPEEVYVREAGVEGSRFLPHDQSRALCPEPVEVDEGSACFLSTTLGAFVCLARIKSPGRPPVRPEDRFTATHVVWVDPTWLTDLESLGRVGRARLFRTATRSPIANETATRITTDPARRSLEFVRTCMKGQRVSVRAVRHVREERVTVAVEETSGCTVLINDALSRPELGTTLAARIVECDTERGLLVVDRGGEIEKCLVDPRPPVTATVVGALTSDESEAIYALLLELAPGIRGRLKGSELPLLKRAGILASAAGTELEVVALALDERGLTLALPEVYEARQRKWTPGEEVRGLLDYLYPRDQEPDVANIEIAPGVTGRLHRRAMRAKEWKRLLSAEQATKVDVVVADVRGPGIIALVSIDAHRAAARQWRDSEKVTGSVLEFYEPQGERMSAHIELAPGVLGRLRADSHPNGIRAGKAALAGMELDQDVEVLIADASGPHLQVKFYTAHLQVLNEGDAVEGTLRVIQTDRNGALYAFVGLDGAGDGFLPGANTADGLRNRKPGDRILVTVIEVNPGNSNPYILKET